MPLMIMTIDTTEIRGRMPEIFSICLPMIHRRKMPRSTGIRTTFTTEITILKKETSTHAPARYTSSGVISGAASVEAMVIPTERATSPPAI